MVKLTKRKYAGIALIGLVVGAVVMLALMPGGNAVPELSLVRDPQTNEIRITAWEKVGTIIPISRMNCMTFLPLCVASGFGGGVGQRNILELVDPSVVNGAAITAKGLVVGEQIDSLNVPVLVTQESFYVLQSSQSIPAKAYVTVTGTVTVYSTTPYVANACSPIDCSYLVLQIQVSQFTVLYQGT
jgi:hypothetical protein